jgi:serine/threonine protein kinase
MLDLAQVRSAFPDYEDLTPLGIHSGQKDVLRARHGSDLVALKLIKPTTQDVDRTLREIEAVARLDSDFVPKVIDHGTRTIGDDERIYLAEHFIDGGSYRARLHADTKPDPTFVLGLAAALLLACRDFEDASLVHRDIKPENIMVGLDEKIWVIDFGIVRILDQESLTATSRHFGLCTPGYGAPEQLRNLKSQIDTRADLFSVGIVLYESLFGSNPHLTGKRDVLEVIQSMERQDLPPLTDIDPELSEFIGVLTARFPSRRPRNAHEALRWFEPIRKRLTKSA